MRWRFTKKITLPEVTDLLKLAGPLIISNLAYTLLGSFDTIFMGRVGALELGAVGVGSTLFLATSVIFRSTAGATMISVSQAYGADDKHKIRSSFQQFICFALCLAPIAFFLPWLFNSYFKLTKPNETVKMLALTYMTIRILELPFSLLSKTISSFMLGIGNSKTPMVISWITVIVNVFFNYVLVFGKLGFPKLGIAGAAWGTILAQMIEFVIYAIIVIKKYNKEYQLTKHWKLPRPCQLLKMLKLGLPMGLADSIDIFTFGILMTIISRLGTVELAASQIANQLNDLAFMPSFAIGTATGSLVGRSLGEHDPNKAERYGYIGLYVGIGIMSIIGIFYWLFPSVFILPFSPNKEVYALSKTLLKLIAFYQLLDVTYNALRGALNGAGLTRFTGFTTVLCVVGVFIPVSYLTQDIFNFGLWGAWSGPIIYVCFLVAILYNKFKDGLWKEPWQKKAIKTVTNKLGVELN